MNRTIFMKKLPEKPIMRMVKYRLILQTTLTVNALNCFVTDRKFIWPDKVLWNKTNRIWRIRKRRVRILNWRWRFCLKIYLKLLNGWLHNSNAFNTEIKKWLWKTMIWCSLCDQSQSVRRPVPRDVGGRLRNSSWPRG